MLIAGFVMKMSVYKHWSRKEDSVLKQYAGVLPAAQIATILNRPKNGVHHRIKKLGLSGRLNGENHWQAKIDNLTATMIFTLHDSGFLPKEIEQFLTQSLTHEQIKTLLYGDRVA